MISPHISVMLEEVLAMIAPKSGEVFVDGTFGAGGYSRALLNAAKCKVLAFDRDPATRPFAEALAREFPGRFGWTEGRFSEMQASLAANGIKKVDGVVLDIGVSSMQIDQPARGFSFMKDGPLDMRMGAHGMTAAEFLGGAEEAQIADIIYKYGEEHASRRIARAIVAARPILTTGQLAETVEKAIGRSGPTHPATRTFQALRIHINDELGELERGLEAASALLAPGGRLAVVTFHSLEDRIVKKFSHSRCGKLAGSSRHLPETVQARELPAFFLPRPEKIKVSLHESQINPRARSATLRGIVREAA